MFDEGANFVPTEATVAAAERRKGNGADAFFGEDAAEVQQSCLDPGKLGGMAPVLLGGEVDEPLGAVEGSAFCKCHEHLADVNFVSLDGGGVGQEVVGEGFFEHEGEALAHYADSVDGVDEGFGGGVEEVSFQEAEH